MIRGLHKVFKAIVNKLKNSLPTLWESGSKVSHFIPEPRNFAELTRLPVDIKKGLVEINFERYQRLNQQSDFSNGWPIEGRSSDTMDVCLQGKIESDGILDTLNLIIVVRGDFQK